MAEKTKSTSWSVTKKLSTDVFKGKKVIENITKALLEARGIKKLNEQKLFLSPPQPSAIKLENLGVNKKQLEKALELIETAREESRGVVVYGDYDADGINATAILWEALHQAKINTMPYIPDRFTEGYGINPKSIDTILKSYPKTKLIITVDNGIVANRAVDYANKKGIQVIVTDHHQKGKTLPNANAVIHTTKISGSGISYLFSLLLRSKFKLKEKPFIGSGLELACIGTVADQLELLHANRSIAYHGINALRKTARPGLLKVFKEAGVSPQTLGTYSINFIIAPRINSTGRLTHALDSLRLLCTKSKQNAGKYANILAKTNQKRQMVVEKVVADVYAKTKKKIKEKIIIVSSPNYHEGVVGLAASKLTESYYLPAIVISKGEKVSKGSARSIAGFDIAKAIKAHKKILLSAGGHTMAAGFSLETKNLKTFIKKMEMSAKKKITKKILTKVKKVDMELPFTVINQNLVKALKKFEPTGLGNPTPKFMTSNARVLDARTVGGKNSHLKLKLEKDGIIFDAIAFGQGDKLRQTLTQEKLTVIYSIDINTWNGKTSIQLNVKDLLL